MKRCLIYIYTYYRVLFLLLFSIVATSTYAQSNSNEKFCYDEYTKHGYYIVTKNGLSGVKSNSGKEVVPCLYDRIECQRAHLSDRYIYYICYNKNFCLAAIYSLNGKLIRKFDGNAYMAPYMSEYKTGFPYFTTNSNKRVQFYDGLGNFLFEANGSLGFIFPFDGGGYFYEVYHKNKNYYYDSDGKLIHKSKYTTSIGLQNQYASSTDAFAKTKAELDNVFPERSVHYAKSSEQPVSKTPVSVNKKEYKTWTVQVPDTPNNHSQPFDGWTDDNSIQSSDNELIFNDKRRNKSQNSSSQGNRSSSSSASKPSGKTSDVIKRANSLLSAGNYSKACSLLSEYHKNAKDISPEEKGVLGMSMMDIGTKAAAQIVSTSSPYDLSALLNATTAQQLVQEGKYLIAEAALLGDKSSAAVLPFLGGSPSNGNMQNQNNDQGGLKFNRHKVTCSLCHGKGTIPSNSGVNYSTGSRYWCDECKEYVMGSHQHVRCPSCNGSGEIEKLF